mmetsp:Transcript_2805/g.3353  ORF Transcript_2805/g.3353 Transcript_2805/m.3353 type:complete len:266 (+) Transcript_2805:47-844(+)
MKVLSDLSSQALARKRRMEVLASQKKVNKRHRIIAESEDDNDDEDTRDDISVLSTTATGTKGTRRNRRTKNSLTCTGRVVKSNTKYQNRYEPEVPMTKEQEAEWRKEARKQRNRESAAASRNKVRNRIVELEAEVEGWKAKYMVLMQRLDALEKATPSPLATRAVPATPDTPRNIYIPATNAPSCSEDREHNFVSIPTVPSLSDNSMSDDGTFNIEPSMSSSFPSQQSLSQQQQHPHPQQIFQQNLTNNVEDLHVTEMTSRPAES